ncbi:olfactory receptor 2A14-like [Dendrobates tinctorius]|uniref:olfactory receptor 2A14-like n=1 Tax=Dendrobates tinctorius TaxID=92724 RepID=UPI003CCA4E73
MPEREVDTRLVLILRWNVSLLTLLPREAGKHLHLGLIVQGSRHGSEVAYMDSGAAGNFIRLKEVKKSQISVISLKHPQMIASVDDLCEHLMDNNTYTTFHILPFSSNTINKPLIAGIFSAIYLIAFALNSVVIALICLDVHLHTPMYLFFCNLSIIDICYTTVIIPKLLHILLSGNGLISFTQCFTQMLFFFIAAGVEDILLFIMGFDRYVAICHPLSYHRILNKKTCVLIVVGVWIFAFLNYLIFVCFLIKMTFDKVVTIKNIFCDAIDIFNASGGGSGDFYIIVYSELVLFAFFPFFCNVLSYVRIIRVILRIKSKEGRRKTSSTCLSHFIVMLIYYFACSMDYMVPFSDDRVTIKQIFSAFYTTVVPMVNPLIYSLRSSEILRAGRRLLRTK